MKNIGYDYIIPLDKGGVDKIWNRVPAQPHLINKRNGQDLIPWLKSQGLYTEETVNRIRGWQLYAYNKWATEDDAPLILIDEY